ESLRPLIEGASEAGFARRIIFSETETQVSAVDGEQQVLLGRGVPEVKQFPFFHPAAPDSEIVLSYRGVPTTAARDPERPPLEPIAADFARRGCEARAQGAGAHAEPPSDDQEILGRLKALGYVS
ncbi:MAG TPA: hypothetical protein VMU02_05185, partial [bacterium]|nr:hypothetical protein [bacterium]